MNLKGKKKGQDNFREEGYVTQGGEEEVESPLILMCTGRVEYSVHFTVCLTT